MEPGASSLELSVVVPAHNSATVISRTAERLAARLDGMHAEIIVVENGSIDDTYERCLAIAERWPRGSISFRVMTCERGMGNALRAGTLSSRGSSVLLTADDLPFDFSDLDAADALRAELSEFPPAIIGSKAHPNSVAPRGAARAVLTFGFAAARRLILGMRTGDPQGTFIVSGPLLRKLAVDLTEPGFLFTTELAYVLERIGMAPVEVPVRLSPSHGSHRSRVRMRDMVAMGVGLFRLRSRHASSPVPASSHPARR